MARKYNFIRKKLVENDTDVIGHIAYSLYKKDKMQYICQWEQEHPNEELTEDILQQYHNITGTDGACDGYRQRAETILTGFFDFSINEMVEKIEKDTISRHKDMVADAVKSSMPKHQFWYSVLQSVIASIIVLVLSIIFVFAKQYGIK